ncbi:GNAT family N-acetyltransferase [Streptomyces sp. NPDC055955]|uniref:GNAT family N-acetyltransferase n=1 Tax=Streptomyces sp. NPDC055955 TaxID=3345665 RepID=UPI0035DDC2E5
MRGARSPRCGCRPEIPAPGFELVAGLATIDTVAVHPDHQHQGHGRALLAEAQARARVLGLVALDA